MAQMLTLKCGSITNPAVPTIYKDQYLNGAGAGALALWDTAYAGSYAKAATASAPVAGDVIRDLAGKGDGVVSLIGAAPTGGQTKMPAYAGGGFDFSGLTHVGSEIAFPSVIAEHIRAQANCYFLEMIYVRLPTQAQWIAAGNQGRIPLACFTDSPTGSATQSELADIFMSYNGTSCKLNAFIASGASYVLVSSADMLSSEFGQLVQVSVYRTAAGVFLRHRSAARFDVKTNASVTKPSLSLVGRKWHIGLGNAFWSAATFPIGMQNLRFYRGAMEDLETSGRDPVAVLDADWTRTVARGVFS